MNLPRRVFIQLTAVGVIAIIAITLLAIGFAHAPAVLFGVGRYTVTVELERSAGLYPRANVTYRGTEVGVVKDVQIAKDGVRAVLSLESGVDIPSDVTVEVHSQSPIGEQYIALLPHAGAGAGRLRDGEVIGANRSTLPPDLNDLLDKTNTALEAIPGQNLQTLIDESYTAIGGQGQELGRLIDGAAALALDAKANLGDLNNVIDNSKPLLDSQADTADAITGWAAHMADITSQLAESNPSVSRLLRNGGPATNEVQSLLEQFKPTLPVLLENLVGVNEVALVYRADLEQIIVLVPQAVQMLAGVGIANLSTPKPYRGAYQHLITNLNLPPPCSTGYLPASQWRTTAAVDTPDRPEGDFYCRIPQDDELNSVRGARNIPCETKPWKRAPSVWMCESDEEYVPLNGGDNWKGDPNATLSGQGVPQLPPKNTSPDGSPPLSAPTPALAFADFNPADGSYIGPDGQVYTQSNLAADAEVPTWQSMLAPPAP